MTNELVQSITAAEEKAAQIKEEAMRLAQEKIAKADAQAAETLKTSASLCKGYRETQLKAAEADAQAAYDAAMGKQREEAQKYAEKLLANTDLASEIVGRVLSGSR